LARGADIQRQVARTLLTGTKQDEIKIMSRAAIILATIFTAILPFSSLSLAASDAEIGSLGDKMSAAFRCSTFAYLSQDQKEQQRLFQIGLKAGRDYVEGLKSRDDLAKGETAAFIRSVSTDFVVGQIYESASTHAYDEIVRNQNGQPLNASEAKTQAELGYRQSNCSSIN
jgi:hypothetical protein